MRKVLLLLLILPFTCICIAQSTQLNDLHFNHLSIKDGLPEDEAKGGETQIQQLTDTHVQKIDKHIEQKEKEIMTV